MPEFISSKKKIWRPVIDFALFRNQREFVRSLIAVISYQTTQNVINLKSFIKQKVITILFLTIHLHRPSYSPKRNNENKIFNVIQMLLENKYVIQSFMHAVQNFMLELSSLHFCANTLNWQKNNHNTNITIHLRSLPTQTICDSVNLKRSGNVSLYIQVQNN